MANGLKTELQYKMGICGECWYTVEELVEAFPVGTGPNSVESTAILVHGVEDTHLLVFPHRRTCSQHSEGAVRA